MLKVQSASSQHLALIHSIYCQEFWIFSLVLHSNHLQQCKELFSIIASWLIQVFNVKQWWCCSCQSELGFWIRILWYCSQFCSLAFHRESCCWTRMESTSQSQSLVFSFEYFYEINFDWWRELATSTNSRRSNKSLFACNLVRFFYFKNIGSWMLPLTSSLWLVLIHSRIKTNYKLKYFLIYFGRYSVWCFSSASSLIHSR